MEKGTSSRGRLRLVPKRFTDTSLPATEAKFLEQVRDAWCHRRCGALRHERRSFDRDMAVVYDFVRYSGKPPWRWEEADFERWCDHLVHERGVAMATERSYQGAVRNFLEYASSNLRFRDEAREKFGVTFTQICNDANCVPHAFEKESMRRAMTHEECTLFFETLDKVIERAQGFKDFWPLQRDKAFFSSLYYETLRISECCGINLNSFLENARFPQFGRFGRVQVFGKGYNGSGPRERIVPINHPASVAIKKWYDDDVRSHFMRSADPNETAFFLNERGRRVQRGGMEARFQKLLREAGLDGRGLVPHSLRRSSVTHESMWTSPHVAKARAGHRQMGTTEGYADYPQPFIENQMTKSTQRLIDKATKEDAKSSKKDKPKDPPA